MKELPSGVAVYRSTPDFDEQSLPDALRRSHTTKAGVWGRIRVHEGELRYRIESDPPEEHVLAPGRDGIVEPEVSHAVEPIGSVRFRVEFLR